MPIERSNPHQTCYMKKLVGYVHTYANQLHKKHLGIPYFYTLTVTTSSDRATAIAEKSANQIGSLAPLSAFLVRLAGTKAVSRRISQRPRDAVADCGIKNRYLAELIREAELGFSLQALRVSHR